MQAGCAGGVERFGHCPGRGEVPVRLGPRGLEEKKKKKRATGAGVPFACLDRPRTLPILLMLEKRIAWMKVSRCAHFHDLRENRRTSHSQYQHVHSLYTSPYRSWYTLLVHLNWMLNVCSSILSSWSMKRCSGFVLARL